MRARHNRRDHLRLLHAVARVVGFRSHVHADIGKSFRVIRLADRFANVFLQRRRPRLADPGLRRAAASPDRCRRADNARPP